MYAMNCILAERPMNVTLLLGANDGLDVWLNGELLLSENRTTEMARPDEFSIPLRLREGDNTLAIKLSQEMGEFGFFGRLTDDVGMVPTGAEFVPVLPGVPVPVISNEEPGWGNDPSPLVHFEPAVAPDPRPFFEIVRHWWTVDSASPSPLEPGELNVADGMGELRMPLLEDGKHVFRIRAEDALGRNGGWAEYTFCTDSSIPQYSPPVPERELITAGERETGSVMARWSWNLTSPTLSGINRTEVLVGTSPGKGDLYAEAVTGHITSYEYANLTSVNGTIFLTVTPVSESRMRGPSVSSTGPIVIDVIGPEKVSNLSVIPRLGENDTRVECYEIAWKPSSDDENGSGIALYVVEYRSQNIPEWRRLGVTSPGINNITFHRPPRSERLRFRIHALDNAGNPGPRSDELEIPNLHPVANITFPGERPTNRTLGVPMRVISNSSFDPDGRITAYFWNFGDGTFSYFPEAYHTYTLPGLYNLSLTVYDDFGNHNRTVIALNLTETDEMDGNGTGGSPGGGVPDAEDQPVKDAPEDVSLGEALNDSPLGYIMLATILAFLALFGYVVGSNILSKRQERLSYSLIGKEKGGNSRGAVEGESTWNDIPVNGTGRSGNGMAHQSVRQTGRGPGRQY